MGTQRGAGISGMSRAKCEEYFQDLVEMREFLGRVSGVTGPPLAAHPLKEATKSESDTVTNIKVDKYDYQVF